MASFGDALAAIGDFRAALLDAQMHQTADPAIAMAFRASAGRGGDGPTQRVHATGVGVRSEPLTAARTDFVIKVFMFDQQAVEQARAEPLFQQPVEGVDVEVEVLPIQSAYATAGVLRHRRRRRPAPGGVEIGPLGGAFVGTLGCYVRQGPGGEGPLYVLSNNHVLADVNRFPLGTLFTQNLSAKPADVIASLSDFEPIQFPSPGAQPRNTMDAAIAAVTDPASIALRTMEGVPQYNPQLMAARPGMSVVKSGRTTGVTQGTIRAMGVNGVQVDYGLPGQPIIATFSNTLLITGAGAAPFSQPGDSGSVILESDSGRPVALLFAGQGANTTACELAGVCARFGVRPV